MLVRHSVFLATPPRRSGQPSNNRGPVSSKSEQTVPCLHAEGSTGYMLTSRLQTGKQESVSPATCVCSGEWRWGRPGCSGLTSPWGMGAPSLRSMPKNRSFEDISRFSSYPHSCATENGGVARQKDFTYLRLICLFDDENSASARFTAQKVQCLSS